MKKKEVYQGAIDAMVQIIDWTPLNKLVSDNLGLEVECRIGTGFIGGVTAVFEEDTDNGIFKFEAQEETRSLILDKECCGATAKFRNMIASDIRTKPFTIGLFEGIGFFKVSKPNKKGGVTRSVFPSYYFDIDEDDVKNCLTDEKIPLYLFMGSRYCYNGRVQKNEYDTLKLIYHTKSQENDFTWKEKKEMTWKVRETI